MVVPHSVFLRFACGSDSIRGLESLLATLGARVALACSADSATMFNSVDIKYFTESWKYDRFLYMDLESSNIRLKLLRRCKYVGVSLSKSVWCGSAMVMT
jgi:hypothetical protein